MQKIAIGALSLLVLVLAATNARLQNRERILEERLASVERNTKRKPAPSVRLDPNPAPVADPAVPAAATTPAATPPEKVAPTWTPMMSVAPPVYTSFVSPDNGAFKAGFVVASPEEKLDLTDAQRGAIVRLREVQLALSQDYERAIRDMLTPEQRARLDAGRGFAHTLWIGQTEATVPIAGVNSGYLGVSGSDASGGGAEVTGVLPNTAASASGLQPGDVILDVNGEPVAGLSALSQKIRSTGAGFAANLRIRRGGVEFIQGLQLGGAPK